MSQLDSELNSLRLRLAMLEEKKQTEINNALDKKAFPLKTLEDIVDAKRKQIERNAYSKGIPLAKFYDQEKLSYLEPILNILVSIQERLDILENMDTISSNV